MVNPKDRIVVVSLTQDSSVRRNRLRCPSQFVSRVVDKSSYIRSIDRGTIALGQPRSVTRVCNVGRRMLGDVTGLGNVKYIC
jgi:hypothetical protein